MAEDYMVKFDEFWRGLVCDEATGELVLDKVARELHDYSMVMDGATEVYMAVANLSKPNTAPHHVIAAHEQRVSEAHWEGAVEALEALRAEIEAGLVAGDKLDAYRNARRDALEMIDEALASARGPLRARS